MIDVVISLIPTMAAAGYYFRIYALILISTCVISAVATEWLCNLMRKKPNPLGDFSAVVTGIILALSLPPSLPVWAAIIGSAFSIAIGKMVFGGLGANIFNPAMAGRAFLTACFGMLMTTWTVPATIDAEMPKITAENKIHALTQATPLAWSKEAIKTKSDAKVVNKQTDATFTGEIGGCLGETSALALLLGGLYLLIRRTINPHIPLAVAISAFLRLLLI
jgi:electron transport complex protein RnfD